MRVIVPAIAADTVAGRALYAEGVKAETRLLHGVCGYAQLLAELWQDGRGFILVEDDVAPWPGVVDGLTRCREPWCGHDYSIGFGRFGLGTLGCVKFGDALLRDHPDLWERWANTHWRQLDAAVVRAVQDATGENRFHVHTPAVAHAKHYRRTA